MDKLERLRKRAERLREINVKLKASILSSKKTNAEQAAEIIRLEGEIRSLLLVQKSGCWDQTQP
jgi:hypothetical protein